jgi:putative ABC transport system permease protein
MLKNYVKIALKVFMRRKFFTFISLFAISFTLVVLMTATAALDHIFATTPPETKQDRTLGVFQALMAGKQEIEIGNPGYAFLTKYVKTLPGVEMVAIYSEDHPVTSFKDGYEIKSQLKRTDGEYWKVLEFQFIEGGPITDEDESSGHFVAVINQATKEKFFGNEPAVGKFIEADRQRFRVVGVVPNVPVYRPVPYSDIWVPISTTLDPEYRESIVFNFNGLILAHNRSDFDRIKRDFQALIPKVPLPSSEFTVFASEAETPFEYHARDILKSGYNTNEDYAHGGLGSYSGRFLALMLLAALLFLLLPTINLVNINISRIIERASEIGVRKSFGASAATLVGQFLVENILLTLFGGIIGFILSVIILQIITNSGLIQYAEFHLNVRIFLYAFASILSFGLLSGVYPAWKMARMHPVNALKGVVR